VPRISHRPARLAVLVSGTGSNLAALLAAAADPDYGVQVVLVGADVPGVPALTRAKAAGVPTVVVPPAAYPDRPSWDVALTEAVAAADPDLVVGAGFMRLLGPAFLDRFAERVLNIHPALLPAFPGTHAVADALAYGVRVTGVTVHLVDAGVDTGPVLAQRCVPVEANDDETTLHERLKTVEHEVLVDVVGRLVREGWTVDGRKVTIP